MARGWVQGLLSCNTIYACRVSFSATRSTRWGRFVGERSRTGHPGTELIAGRGDQELPDQPMGWRWREGFGGRDGCVWVWGTDDGTKYDGRQQRPRRTAREDQHCAALQLHCDGRATRMGWMEGAAM